MVKKPALQIVLQVEMGQLDLKALLYMVTMAL